MDYDAGSHKSFHVIRAVLVAKARRLKSMMRNAVVEKAAGELFSARRREGLHRVFELSKIPSNYHVSLHQSILSPNRSCLVPLAASSPFPHRVELPVVSNQSGGGIFFARSGRINLSPGAAVNLYDPPHGAAGRVSELVRRISGNRDHHALGDLSAPLLLFVVEAWSLVDSLTGAATQLK
uniref:Uncharacterized protein n=1 Tax=Ditylenchus dipsaci TaxID=166011 RepID=A0A915EUA2_9BILA